MCIFYLIKCASMLYLNTNDVPAWVGLNTPFVVYNTEHCHGISTYRLSYVDELTLAQKLSAYYFSQFYMSEFAIRSTIDLGNTYGTMLQILDYVERNHFKIDPPKLDNVGGVTISMIHHPYGVLVPFYLQSGVYKPTVIPWIVEKQFDICEIKICADIDSMVKHVQSMHRSFTDKHRSSITISDCISHILECMTYLGVLTFTPIRRSK